MEDYRDDELGSLSDYPEEQGGIDAESVDDNAVPEAEADTVIYTGPNIFALALQRFQVFRGGLPPYVKRAIEKIPEIKQLIVPVNKLEGMRARINKPGTAEARFFNAVQKAADKAAKERKAKK